MPNLPTYAADTPRSSTAAMSNSNLSHNMLDGGRSHSPSSFPPHHAPSISTSLSRTGARPVPQGKEAPFDLPAGYQESLIASGSGLNVFLALAEPMIFLEGFDRGDTSTRKTALLRGSLRVKVTKTAKIKKIYLNFRGLSQTVWPEGRH
ncbi:hypothetical protein KEM55_004106 [Ascosphaera atra]|nr:hypothetical protein KEM55_004106 [Ascosphaera atra]